MHRIIVCERGGTWAAELARRVAGSGIRVRQTRSLALCEVELAASPRSLLVLEAWPENVGSLIEFMRLPERRGWTAPRVIVGGRDARPYFAVLREAGGCLGIESPRQLGAVVALAKRYFAQLPQGRPPLAEEVWAKLPWEDESTAAA